MVRLDGFQEMIDGWRDVFAEDRSKVLASNVGDRHLIAEMRQSAWIGDGVPVEMTNYYLLEIRDGRASVPHLRDRDAAMAAVRP